MAQDWLKRHDYEQAIQILRSIPDLCRSDETEELLQQAVELQEEADDLLLHLKNCVQKRQYDGIEADAKRLLELKPGNQFAKNLWEKLHSYRGVPAASRRYRFDSKGRLLPMNDGGDWTRNLILAGLTGLLVFGLMTWGIVIYLRNDDQTLAVEVDDEWLKQQNGQLTLTVDGKEHTLAAADMEVKVTFGDHGFSVKSGDAVVHNPQTFTIEKQGRQVLRIDATGMRLVAAGTPPIADPGDKNAVAIDAPRTPLPDGPPGMVKELKGHTKKVVDLAVSPRGDSVCSISEDQTMRLWELATGNEIWNQKLDAPPHVVAFHPSGRQILLATSQLARICETETGQVLHRLTQDPAAVYRAAWSSDGNQLATLATDGVRVWSFEGNQPPRLNHHIVIDLSHRPSGLAFARDPNHILVSQASKGGDDPDPFGLRLFDASTGKEVRRYTDPITSKIIEGGGDDISVTPKGNVVAFKAIKMPGHSWDPVLFDIESGRIVRHPKSQGAPQFSPSGQSLAVGDEDDIVITDGADQRVWETQSKLHNAHRLAFTPDGRYVISGGGWYWDHQANVMNTDAEFPITVWRLPQKLWPELKSTTSSAAAKIPDSPALKDSWTSTSGQEFVWCPPGKFRMGSGETPLPDANETPVDVTLSQGLWVAKREVTQAQWKAVMGTEPWKTFQDHRDGANHAASHVTWTESVEFCRKLTETERKAGTIPADWEFRLPTEAEWEYFARAGTTTR